LSKHLYKTILDTLSQAVLVLDKQLKIITCNLTCENFFSKPVDKIVGKKLSEVIPHQNLQNQAKIVMQNEESGTKFVEFHLDTEKMGSKILRATITRFREEDFGIPFCFIMLENVTEQIELEDKLLQSEKRAGMEFLARSIAHELGNPLSIAISTIQYIQSKLSDVDNEDLKESIEILKESAEEIHTLLRNLSDFSNLKRPQFEFCNFHHIILQLLSLIRKEAKMHNIKIYREFDEKITTCQLDKQGIRQLFLNLFKNAIESMPQGGELHIKTYLVPGKLPEDEEKVVVEISDTGEGIGQTEMQYIFRPFYSSKTKGAGLGLSLCRRVVEDHGGEISVKSEVGRGTTFTVSLPVRQAKEVQAWAPGQLSW